MDAWVKVTKKRQKSTRAQGDDASTRSRRVLAGSGGASKVEHVQQSAHREVDLTISISSVYGSKSALNMTSRLLRQHGQRI